MSRRKYNKQYYLKNKAKHNEWTRRYYQKHKEERRIKSREYYLKNRKRILEQCKKRGRSKEKQREYDQRHYKKYPLRSLMSNIKRSAKERGLEFNLKEEDIKIPNKCPVLGMPLEFGSPKYNSPSIDRFDNSKGYTKGNIRVISYRANVLKNDATLKEMEAIINYMKDNLN